MNLLNGEELRKVIRSGKTFSMDDITEELISHPI